MACYISSNDNRYYAALEPAYGTVAAVTAADRFPAVRLRAAQQNEIPRRADKTGTRTWQGTAGRLRRRTNFALDTYLVSRETAGQAPGYAPLIEAALGGSPRVSAPVQVQSASGAVVTTATAHGLSEGMAVTFGGEIRMVMATPDAQTAVLAAPFTVQPGAGSVLGEAVSFAPARQLGSVSLYDCWSPSGSVQRVLRGAAVDRMEIRVNGDYHEIGFEGLAADLLDSASFETGQGGLTQFPAEPAVGELNYAPVPGHLGRRGWGWGRRGSTRGRWRRSRWRTTWRRGGGGSGCWSRCAWWRASEWWAWSLSCTAGTMRRSMSFTRRRGRGRRCRASCSWAKWKGSCVGCM